jgi:glutamate---cysteine ligase / carboxylate-amine ligase
MSPLHLFQAFGVELEYMVVNKTSLAVCPIVDLVLKEAAKLPGAVVEAEGDPEFPNQVELGDIAWSNELTLHVLELKTTAPAAKLEGLDQTFAAHIRRINQMLDERGCMLLPGGMHPTMDPFKEMKLWPHDYSPVYNTFNKIFDCRGHGWANLQAVHLNLPFHGDTDPEDEFGRLHAAVRILLPILPALAASTPVMDGGATGVLDNRLEVYRTNSRRIPAAAGMVVPEPVYTRANYDRVILQEIYRQYAPHDPEGVMRYEWANSRGAIARFMRDTIEVRVLDVQECAAADVAICAGVTAVLRAITEGGLGNLAELRAWPVEPLHEILLSVIRDADQAAVITDSAYLEALGFKGHSCTANELWRHLLSLTLERSPAWPTWRVPLSTILDEGPLARRLLKALGSAPTREHITATYRRLTDCLQANVQFMP